ncbi:MAG: hypothetical protein AAGC64_13335 [Bacteroidota bacterium]
MRITRIHFFLTLLNLANLSFGQQEFLNELGPEKTESFEELVNSYERFLQLNYPTIEGKGERTRAFMQQLIDNKEPFKFDSLDAIQIISELDRTGLRKDIFLYEGETYEPTYEIERFFPEIEVKPDTSEIDDDFNDENIDYSKIDTSSWETFLAKYLAQLPPEERRREEEREKKRIERKKWSSNPNPNSLYHYALLKSDTSFIAYCWLRYDGLTPAISQTLLDLLADELEHWKTQMVFVLFSALGHPSRFQVKIII